MGWINKKDLLGKIPDFLFHNRVSFTWDEIPFEVKNMGWKRRINLVKTGIDMVVGLDKVLALPPIVQVEP